MFWNKNKVKMKNLKLLRTSSKKALMDSAIFVCDGNYQKAGELYDLYVSRMDLPDFDPVPISGFDKAKDTAVTLFGWLKENQNEVMGVIDFVKNIRSGGGGTMPPTTPTNLPPI